MKIVFLMEYCGIAAGDDDREMLDLSDFVMRAAFNNSIVVSVVS